MFIKNNKVIVIICILFYFMLKSVELTTHCCIGFQYEEENLPIVVLKKKGKPEKYSDMHVLPKQISFETIPEQGPEN